MCSSTFHDDKHLYLSTVQLLFEYNSGVGVLRKYLSITQIPKCYTIAALFKVFVIHLIGAQAMEKGIVTRKQAYIRDKRTYSQYSSTVHENKRTCKKIMAVTLLQANYAACTVALLGDLRLIISSHSKLCSHYLG